VASVHKLRDSKGRIKPHWFCFYSDEQGNRKCKTTKTANRKEADTICAAFQRAANKGKNNRLTESTARKLVEEVVAEIMESAGTPLKRYSVREWFNSWINGADGALAEETHTRYNGVKDNFLTFLNEKADASILSIRGDDIQRYRDSLTIRLTSGTVNLHLKVLRVGFGKAVRANIIDANPASLVENLNNRKRHHRRAFTMAELKKLLATADDDWKLMIIGGLYTGLRLNDLANLTWQNIDLQNSELNIGTGKDEKFLNFPLAKPFLKLLEDRAGDDPKAPIFPPLLNKKSHWLSNQFYDLMASVGLVKERTHQAGEEKKGRSSRRQQSEITFHALRHTATSLLKNAGVSNAIAMDIIGHDSESVSRNYTHIEMETKRAAINKMPDVTK
jgi:integrase